MACQERPFRDYAAVNYLKVTLVATFFTLLLDCRNGAYAATTAERLRLRSSSSQRSYDATSILRGVHWHAGQGIRRALLGRASSLEHDREPGDIASQAISDGASRSASSSGGGGARRSGGKGRSGGSGSGASGLLRGPREHLDGSGSSRTAAAGGASSHRSVEEGQAEQKQQQPTQLLKRQAQEQQQQQPETQAAPPNSPGYEDVDGADELQGGQQVPAETPPLETVTEPAAATMEVPERCVVVLGTGRSGSTSLTDSLNQLPNYLIRGEQEGAFWYLYLTWRLLERAWSHSQEFQEGIEPTEQQQGSHAAAHLGFGAVKEVYDSYAVQKKLPWFNDLHPARLVEAVRAFYLATYGYHGPGVVSGFKEVRFVRGRAFSAPSSSYEDFEHFIRFLRLMCLDVKVLLNSRSSASLEDNYKLGSMLLQHGVIQEDQDTFVENLQTTHEWYDRYAAENPDHAFRVTMEDMFDPEKNATLARGMLTFLGEDPATPISFDRMPTWSDPASEGSKSSSSSSLSKRKRRSKKTGQPREPWLIRRSMRQQQQQELAAQR